MGDHTRIVTSMTLLRIVSVQSGGFADSDDSDEDRLESETEALNGSPVRQNQEAKGDTSSDMTIEPDASGTSIAAKEREEREGDGHFITEHQIQKIKQLADETEQASRKMKKVLEDIRGKDTGLLKWPQTRREVAGVILGIFVGIFILVAGYFFICWYCQKTENPVPTWWEHLFLLNEFPFY